MVLFERLQALGALDSSLVPPEDASSPRHTAGGGGGGFGSAEDTPGSTTRAVGGVDEEDAFDAAARLVAANGGVDASGDDSAGASMAAGLTPSEASLSGKRTFKLTATYLQIYNETLIDMLAEAPADLKVRNSPQLGVFVSGLTEHPVRSPQDVLDLLERGNKMRATASTKMNAASSRSHAVFTLNLEQEIPMGHAAAGGGEQPPQQPTGGAAEGGDGAHSESFGMGESGGGGWVGKAPGADGIHDEDGNVAVPLVKRLRSKINLVDLAGSERAKQSGADADAALMKECVNINKSLSALGNVVKALSEGRSTHVPYRESKLTMLLEESLGGNAQTVMINAVSPLVRHHAETLSTLTWAKRAQSIINVATAGIAMDADSAMEKMAAMAAMQKQAIAEAQQQARERQQELQEQLEAARAAEEAPGGCRRAAEERGDAASAGGGRVPTED